MPPSIVVCGNDPTLLLTRKLVLEHAGLRVDAVLGLARLMEKGEERLLLCSSLSESERLEAILATRRKGPSAKILVVGGEKRGYDDVAVLNVSAFASAETLIENAKWLIR